MDFFDKPMVLSHLKLLDEAQHTGALEFLHAVMVKYAPKRLNFSLPGYLLRVRLAILDHNENVGREVKTGESF